MVASLKLKGIDGRACGIGGSEDLHGDHPACGERYRGDRVTREPRSERPLGRPRRHQ